LDKKAQGISATQFNLLQILNFILVLIKTLFSPISVHFIRAP